MMTPTPRFGRPDRRPSHRNLRLADATGSCLPRIRSRLRGRSKAAAKIAEFVLASPSEARNMPITSLATACDTSLSTISRFCRDLGYSSYREFQLDLATAVAQAENSTLDDFQEGATPEAVIQRVFACNRQSLVETEKMVDHAALIDVAQRIRRCRRLLLLGNGGSAQVARQAAERFTSLGIMALPLEDPYFRIFATANVGRGDMVIGISHTGQNALVVEAIRTARQKGADTVALTNYPSSPLAQAGAICLTTAYREHRTNAAVSSSIIAQMCVMDCLYFILGSWSSRNARQMADEAETRARQVLRRTTS